MSARIFAFRSPAEQLRLEGFTLIAWRIGAERWDEPDEPQWLHGIWRPAEGKGWYESGYLWPEWSFGDGEACLEHSRISRAGALRQWRLDKMREPYKWHHLMTEAQAFPERHRRYMRPPRLPRFSWAGELEGSKT